METTILILALTITPVISLVGTRQAQSDSCGYLDPSALQGDFQAETPWTAAIYHRAGPKSPFRFFLNGAIIGPTTVLTIYGGVYGVQPRGSNKDQYVLPLPENSLIVAGSLTTGLKNSQGQIAQVEYILPYKGHEPHNQQYHFIVYRLKTPLDLNTTHVRAICLPYFSQRPGKNMSDQEFYSVGYASGGNLTSTPMIKFGAQQCRPTFTYHYKTNDSHVFCSRKSIQSGVTSSSEIQLQSTPCLSHGTLAVKQVNGRWYLQGLLALVPGRKRGACNDKTLYFFGKLTGHVEWLANNVKCSPKEFPCFRTGVCVPLSSACNLLEDCLDSSDEDNILCSAYHRQDCEPNDHPCGIRGKCISSSKICDKTPDCPDASDESPKLCERRVAQSSGAATALISTTTALPRASCFPLTVAEGVQITCKNVETQKSVDCSAAGTGTTAFLTCQPYYSAKNREASIQMTCGPDGLWNPFKPFSCEANCGIISTDVKGFLYGGITATRSNAFPWHAALFAQNQNGYEYVCGASLIEKRVLVTSAHCLLDFSLHRKFDKFRVALAPASSDYDENVEDELARVFQVQKYWTHPNYNAKTLTSDIALIQVNDSVPYGQFIRPVCYLPMQGGGANSLLNRSGKIAGFDLREASGTTNELKYITIPVVPNANCTATGPRQIPPNTFCAGSPEVAGLCRGDSGGGLVFSEKKSIGSGTRYILKGVASASAGTSENTCLTQHFSFFTEIEKYADWIYETLENIDFDA